MVNIDVPIVSVKIDGISSEVKELNALIHKYPKLLNKALRIEVNNIRRSMAKTFGSYKHPKLGINLQKKDAITRALQGKSKKSPLTNYKTIKVKTHGNSFEVGYMDKLAPYAQRFQSGVPRHIENEGFRHFLYVLLNSKLKRGIHTRTALEGTIPLKSPPREVVSIIADATAKKLPHDLISILNSQIQRMNKK